MARISSGVVQCIFWDEMEDQILQDKDGNGRGGAWGIGLGAGFVTHHLQVQRPKLSVVKISNCTGWVSVA